MSTRAAATPDTFSRLLHAEISDHDPDTFSDNVTVLLLLAQELTGDQVVSRRELKILIRHLARRFEHRSGNQLFSTGAYFHFFAQSDAAFIEDSREHLLLEGLSRLSRLLDDETLTVASLSPLLFRKWRELLRLVDPDRDGSPVKPLLWRVVAAIIGGELQINGFHTERRTFAYPAIARPPQYRRRCRDTRRQELLQSLRFSEGDARIERPSLVRFVRQESRLHDVTRDAMARRVASVEPGQVEPLATVVRHHAHILALGDKDMVSLYYRVLDELIAHLVENVFTPARSDAHRRLTAYLRCLREAYLPALRTYCLGLRAARARCPLLADLLLEPYLLRIGGLDGTQEPSVLSLLEDWTAIQRVAEAQAARPLENAFSLLDCFVHGDRDGVAGPMQAARTDARRERQSSGRPVGRRVETDKGFPVVELADYNTFVQLPVLVERRPPATASASRPSPSEDPFDFFNAITERLPVIPTPAIDLHRARTVILPILPDPQADQAGSAPQQADTPAYRRAVTEILQAQAEHPLQRADTYVFPIQSVDLARSETICLKMKRLVGEQGGAPTLSDRLRHELRSLEDADRIIAEQFLARRIEREMTHLTERLGNADHQTVEELDELLGLALSSVMQRYAVTRMLRRIFVSECYALYANFRLRAAADHRTSETIHLAIVTVLNAYQDRLALPGSLERQLRALDPGMGSLSSRLSLTMPEELREPPNLRDLVQQTAPWEIVFDTSYLLQGYLRELNRFAQRAGTLELFVDAEAAIGTAGVNQETYVGFCQSVRDRAFAVTGHVRELQLRLEERGGGPRELARFLRQVHATGREVWRSQVHPALVFYARMAFGERRPAARDQPVSMP